jgi:methyl-accepting chemotaxis protein WspA
MFRNLSIKTKLSTGFGVIVAMVLVVLALAYNNFARLSEADQWNRHTLEVLLETKHVATDVLQVQSSIRGYLLTGSEALLAPIHSDYASAREHLDRALQLTADNPAQQGRLKQLQAVMTQWMDQSTLPHPQGAHRVVTMSIGVASCIPGADLTLEDLVREADGALYDAKHGGRNRVAVAPER